jgi:hypothetical protein
MFEETWSKLYCPAKYCTAPNWICLGDLEDITASDIEAVTCWSCKQKFLRVDRETLMDMYGHDLDEGQTLEDYIHAEDGKQSPTDDM